jgi:hypothetical protein
VRITVVPSATRNIGRLLFGLAKDFSGLWESLVNDAPAAVLRTCLALFSRSGAGGLEMHRSRTLKGGGIKCCMVPIHCLQNLQVGRSGALVSCGVACLSPLCNLQDILHLIPREIFCISFLVLILCKVREK